MLFQSSWIYRLLSGSWLLGWLVARPDDNFARYEFSWLYRLGCKIREPFFARANEGVAKLADCSGSSRLTASPLQFTGVLLIICLLLSLAFHRYFFSDKKILLGFSLAALLILARYWRVMWENSFICRTVNWWNNTE
jgi:hypothetical protein